MITPVWDRAIILVDMNAFFASIEQLDEPKLRYRPVAVTNGLQGACVITCSYEARAFGIKTGMSIYEAKKHCPDIIQRSARPKRYSEISKRIMKALIDITPDVEIFSIDEAFLDITGCQKLFGAPEEIAAMTKQCVWQASHLPCSIGVSGDKTTAKYAAKKQKPDSITIIPPWKSRQALADVPVTELCGINQGIANFLAQYHIYFCGDIERIPISVLAKRYGVIGKRIWLMCQGLDPSPVNTSIAAPKSMGHGKVLPPKTAQANKILTYLLHMSERLAARLRRHHLSARQFWIGLHAYLDGWLGDKVMCVAATQDGREIYQLAQYVFECCFRPGMPIRQVQITALDPRPDHIQADLFIEPPKQRQQLNAAIDVINDRYGELCIAPAKLLHRATTPNVIAPSWKPSCHRESI